jgi:glycosyltransferase involved in cell wall biosynthesis
MRIGIDARYLSHGLAGGVHTYVRELIPALVEVGTAHEFVLYADGKRAFELDHLGNRVAVRVLPWTSAWSTIRNDFRFARVVAADGIDVLHFPANYGVGPATATTVVTLHDTLNLLPLRQAFSSHGSRQTLRTRATSAYLRWWTSRSVRRADLVLTVSEFSRSAILEMTRFAADRVVAVPHGAPRDADAPPNATILARVREELDLANPFVLADGLKNPEVLLRAWDRVPAGVRSRHAIVFFARHRQLLPSVVEAVSKGVARLIVRPTRDQLAAMYAMADAFVFPSWIEGFGLPVLEAMAYGAPVVSSTRGALPEVVGDAGCLFDPEDEGALGAALTRVLGSEAERQRFRSRGFERARQFSWTRTAEQVLAAYARARERRRS